MASPWRDSLRPASFRGVPFEVLSSERPVGRVVAVHTFPNRDTASGEDMGQVPGAFKLEAFLIGPDYMTAREVFEAALKKPGTGVLVVPWQGQRTVRLVSGGTAHESTAEGGMVRYQLEFMEEPDAAPAAQSIDTAAAANTAADALQAQAIAKVTTEFNVTGRPNFVTDEASKIVGKLADQFDSLTAPLKAAGDTLDGYVAGGLELRNQVFDLVAKPFDLAARISGLIQDIRTIAETPADALNALKGLMGFGSAFEPVSTATSARQAQATNQEALVACVQYSAAAEAIRALAETDFAAYQDAVDARDSLGDAVDDIAIVAGDAGDDVSWKAVTAARLAMILDINARGGSLATVYGYTPTVTTSALVLAYRLYDDGSRLEERAQQLIDRNRIFNPVFVPGGIELEVLSDV